MKFLCLNKFIILLVVITGAFAAFTDEQERGLAKHNEFREIHQVPLMTLDQQLCDDAQEWAEEIARLETLQHSPRNQRQGQGETLSMGCSSNAQTVDEAVTNWYNEVCHPGYNFDNGKFSSGTGHFTQVIWKGSTKLGIGRAEKDIDYHGFTMKCAYIVGRYQPPGNFLGDYTENVPKGNFDPSYCDTISSKRRKYYDAKGNPVIAVTPLTEVDVPEETNGKSANAHFHAHGHNTKRLNGKEKN